MSNKLNQETDSIIYSRFLWVVILSGPNSPDAHQEASEHEGNLRCVSEQLLLLEEVGATQGERDLPSLGPVQKLVPALPLPLHFTRLFRWASSCSFQNLTKVKTMTKPRVKNASQRCKPEPTLTPWLGLSSHLGTPALSHHPASAPDGLLSVLCISQLWLYVKN